MTANQTQKIVRGRAYYMESVKFIRDMVHGYVYLTEFDLELIDTIEFQRLKDIRQLKCQNVYPAARHTRFEHSLGVLELTRQALRSLNQNGILTRPSPQEQPIFDDQLIFNASLAALLHDVGHCPFSHMGEVEFDKEDVFEYLCNLIEKCSELETTSLLGELKKNKSGSAHEQMSCIVILEKLYYKLSTASWKSAEIQCSVDFELIIRSIIGLPYKTSTTDLHNENKKKNVIVGFINSTIFDMDKLDYIMRDALSTGIGTPKIDTHRLFNNMYINSDQDYTLVFLHRAVPALQNMIEARDALYMYVYNHHVTVFSDFMYSYIFRRLAHNAEDFQNLVRASIPAEVVHQWEASHVGEGTNSIDIALSESLFNPITNLGIVPKSYLFSPEAILEQKRSDSDMISLLHDIYYLLSQYPCFTAEEDKQMVEWALAALKSILHGEILTELESVGIVLTDWNAPEDAINRMLANIRRVFSLIEKYQKREYLKPWWKTNFEFTNFIDQNFNGTPAHEKLSAWICHSDKESPRGDEVRSQLAKHVIYITNQLLKQYSNSVDLLEPLEDGDFFVIQRSARFLDKDTISKLNIALKRNEILGNHNSRGAISVEYFIDKLTKIFPQRDYYELYEKNGFYIFSKPLREGTVPRQKCEKHYHLIEEIFVFVAKKLTESGEVAFQEQFVTPSKATVEENERKSWEKMFTMFAQFKGLVANSELR